MVRKDYRCNLEKRRETDPVRREAVPAEKDAGRFLSSCRSRGGRDIPPRIRRSARVQRHRRTAKGLLSPPECS